MRYGLAKLFYTALSCLLLFGMALPAPATEAAAADAARTPPPAAARLINGYRLGPGDVLTIRVYGEDDMTREKFRLPDSGIVSFPFGDVCALGITVPQLEELITNGLRGDYLVNPRVSVSIEEYRPFFIYGQVEKPGGYPFQPGLNLRKAVSLAGGFRERASQSKIYVVREGDAGNAARKIDLNAPIGPGDTVTVEESFF